MGKISKSDQPARLDDDEATRLAEIDARLHDMRRGHHAEGAGWTMRMIGGAKIHMRLHWQSDGSYILLPDRIYDDFAASLR